MARRTTSPHRELTAVDAGHEAEADGTGSPVAPALAWAGFVGLALAVGTLTVRNWPDADLHAAPLFAHWDARLEIGLIPAVLAGALTVAAGPALAARLRWPGLLAAAGAATVGWSISLAVTDGWSRLAAPLGNRHDYLTIVHGIAGPRQFLRSFIQQMGHYPTHVRAHPPAMPLLLWALDDLHLGGTGWAAGVVLAGSAGATIATLIALRAVAGEATARRAAPFVAVAPSALWLATSDDAFYAGVAIAGCALLIAGRRPLAYVVGGVLLGLAFNLSYGLVLVVLVPAAVAAVRRDVRPLAWAALGVAVVGAAFADEGFWWFDGFAATHHFYELSAAARRPYAVITFLMNPAAAALATGPAAAAGLWALWRHRDRGRDRARRWLRSPALLPLSSLTAIGLANLSGMSKGEVERIWLPFYPWILGATAQLPRRQVRLWLAAQVALAVVIQAALRTPW